MIRIGENKSGMYAMLFRSSAFLGAVLLLTTPLWRGGGGLYLHKVQPPRTIHDGEVVPMKVNALTSIRTQVPKDYYHLPFCQPPSGPKMASQNLGEFLTENKIQSSPYDINMLLEVHCQILCQVTLNRIQSAKLKMHIKLGYHNNWIIDNLPSAIVGTDEDGKPLKHYAGGFPIGFIDKDTTVSKILVYNHVRLIIDYHQPDESTEGYRVVGFSVEPISVKHRFAGGYEWDGNHYEGYTRSLDTCPSGKLLNPENIQQRQIVDAGEKIIYTYDVIWRESQTTWASRWDVYLTEEHSVSPQVHWYSITNSIIVMLFFSFLVVSILMRSLRRDIAGYSQLPPFSDEDIAQELDETGWKLLHADVFRPPSTHPVLYCVLVGSGVQIGVAAFLVIVFSAFGFVNIERRGSLMIAILVFYFLCGSLAGYSSSRLYKTFHGRRRQMCTVLTATCFPGFSFLLFLFMNIILFSFRSTGSVPFIDVIIVAMMWYCISLPLVFLGAHSGYKTDAITFPTATSTMARAIPESTIILHPMIGVATAGIVTFSVACVELFVVMTSLWMDQFYYSFGFILIVYIILLITCAELAVLLCYFQLCAENHRWWWYVFFIAGSTAFYTFLFSIFWFKTLRPSDMLITHLLYFGYMFVISLAIFLVTGTVGVLTCLWFIRKIFSSIKVDRTEFSTGSI